MKAATLSQRGRPRMLALTGAVFALWGLYLLATQGQQTFLSALILGLITGSVFAVAASGLVVTYTTSGIFNFAHGAIGMVMAFLYWQLDVKVGLPTIAAFVLVVFVFAPLTGALLEVCLIRRFSTATVTTRVVATIALLVFFLGLGLQLYPPTEGRTANAFFTSSSVTVFGVSISGPQLVNLFASLAAAVALFVVLNRTRVGLAMRAVVDDRGLVALNGANPSQVSMLSWAIGASLSALAGVLLAPVLTLDQLILTLLIINAFAAAIAGQLKSLPGTFAGAFALGLLLEFYRLYQPETFFGRAIQGNWQQLFDGLADALPIVFLFLALLFLPADRLRVGRLVGAKTPRVPSLRESIAGAVVLVAAMYVASGFLETADIARYGKGLALAIVMLSLVPLTGYAAQLSMAQMSFAGVGAFVVGKIGTETFIGSGSILGLVLAAGAAAAVGMLVALPALRLQGLYLALTTMAFAVLMDRIFFGKNYGFGLGGSIGVHRLDLGVIDFEDERAFFVLMAAVFGLIGIGVLALKRGPFGRKLAALRDSPAACATLGLDLTRTKLTVFALSAAIAGVGGVMFGGLNKAANVNDFRLENGLIVLLLAVLGGVTTVSGALVGGAILAALTTQDQGVVFMLIAAGTVLLGKNPNGLAFFVSERLGRLLRRDGRPSRPSAPAAARPAIVGSTG